MNISPVQLIETDILRISVDYNARLEEDDDESNSALQLQHLTKIRRLSDKHSDSEENSAPTCSYFVMVGLKSSKEMKETQPYSFEIVISGRIEVVVNGRSQTEVNDMAAKYGFTMLYSQIRETLLNVTARMRHGEYMLPTMSFLDSTYSASDDDEKAPPSSREQNLG